MRIALVVDAFAPSAGVLMFDLAKVLARDGHAVTVITPAPDRATPCLFDEATGMTFLRIHTGKLRGIGLVRRALNELLMPARLWRGARQSQELSLRLDAVVWYSPNIFFGPFVAWLKHKTGARTYLVLRDIFPEWAVDAGVMRRGIAYWIFKAFERYQYRVADVIGVQSPANLAYFKKRRPHNSKLEVLFNWADLSRPEPPQTDLLARLGLTGKRILVYGGTMGVAQDMENILRLAEQLRGLDGLRLLLIGGGSEVPRLKRLVASQNLANVVFVDEVAPDVFRAVLRGCHIGLISLDRRLKTHNIPGKLLAYLECGLPVVASVNPGNDLLSILPESGAGEALLNGQDTELAALVMRILRDDALRLRMSASALALAQRRFNVETTTRQLINALT